ncbi:MAG: sigma-54 factor interaction domain-containing protein, partial [Fibrobacteres bacterium]|nr:sigma-54 factor interaction domain-containing protein [Fibrobacterota bacterium]
MFGNANEEFVAKELKNEGSVAHFYDFSEFDPLAHTQNLKQIRQFTNQQFVIHSKIPFSAWKTVKISDTEFFGRIAFLDMAPNVTVPGYAATVLVDNNTSTIFGIRVNSRESELKKKEFSEKLIGIPVSKFFYPTPNEFAAKNRSSFSWEEKSHYKTVYHKNFIDMPLDDCEEVTDTASFRRVADGLLMENNGKQGVYLSPDIQLDTRRDDFIFSIRCKDLSGEGPYLTFGEKYQNDLHLPDDIGYLGGFALSGSKVIFKKHGFITAGADFSGIKNGDYTLALAKTGRTLRLFLDKEELLTFFDNDFTFDLKGFVSIGLRKGRKSLIKSVELLTRKSVLPFQNLISLKHIVMMNSDSTRYYNLERFYTAWLSNPELSHVAGYYLSDITELQMKTVTLDKEYQAQVKKGKELSKLLEQYQTQEEMFTVFDEKMVKFKESARIAAESEATILIEGETGTGKEVLANYIHKSSKRVEHPFVKVDCTTIPATLIENHLFGHEKGAFTGATHRTVGMFEKADKGTLFLDEISNLPLDTQAKLLQFFNDFTIIRIGGTQPIKLNVRCI